MQTQGTTGTLQFAGHALQLESVSCDFCGGTKFVPWQGVMRHGVNLPTVFCERCSLCQTNPRPTPAAIRLFYEKLYRTFYEKEPELLEENSAYVTHSARTANPRTGILARFLPADQRRRVFEVGTGAAQFQRLARERTSWQVSGIEPGKEQAAFAQRLGFAVENRFLDELEPTHERYDAVVAFHVMEHTLSPADFVRRLNALLDVDGLLYLEVPNLERPGGPFANFLQLPHLYNFSAMTLRNYLTAIGGFRTIFLSENANQLSMIARKVSEPRQGHPAEGEFEATDLNRLLARLKLLSRMFRLAGVIPNVPVLRKVRSSLMAI